MKRNYRTLSLPGCLLIVLLVAACSKKIEDIPETTAVNSTIAVKTVAPSVIDFASAISGGVITSPGNLPVLQQGICYKTAAGPTVMDSVIFSDSSLDSFRCTLTRLKPATRYYVRAFAKNEAGTFYGDEVSFQMGIPYGAIDYDATYYPPLGSPYAYHVSSVLYFIGEKNYEWSTYIYASHDTLYRATGTMDSSFALSKGCIALVSNVDPAQQPSYKYYVGSYYKFSFFNDTAIGNLQFMVPTDNFPSVDSIPVTGVPGAGGLPDGYFLMFTGGINSYYKGMAKSEVKVWPDKHFVQTGDSFSYANPLIPAQGNIDSAEVSLYVRRFSDNGIHFNPQIAKTIDGHVSLKFYFHDGSRLTLINGEFMNIPFHKTSM